ncbi:MAG: replicative DNA helicase [Phycisphaerales bacterium]|nr:replicative DNA helicase [Phycisphaerales bacterium]
MSNPPKHHDQGSQPQTGSGKSRSVKQSSQATARELTHLLEALPPHAMEAEVSLLGSMLLEPTVVGDVVQTLRGGSDFFKPANGAIYDAMVELYDKHASVDIVQLNQLLADRDVLNSVGGLDYLLELANAVPSATNAPHYARLVRQKATIRRLISAAGEILVDAHQNADDAETVLNTAEQRIFEIAQQGEERRIESLHELITEAMTVLEKQEGRTITGVPTGFSELDEVTGGLQPGEFIIVAARPSIGKTALALNMAEYMATHDYPVGLFSLEMSKQQLVQRLLAARAQINSQRLRRNMLRTDDYRSLMTACGELMSAPLFIDDTPGLTLMQLRAKARRMSQKHGIKALFIDYLQLMSLGGRVESRQQEVSSLSRGVKALARELDIPVVCLSQLNRAAAERTGHRPLLNDLRESGAIEQDADVVTMLHREEYYHASDPTWIEANPDKAGFAELIIAKQRNGPTPVISLSWQANSTRFLDYAPETTGAGLGAFTTGGNPYAPGGAGSGSGGGAGGGAQLAGIQDDLDDGLPPI